MRTVAVWSSDPRFGDPYEGVFYMKPPYTPADVRLHAEQSGRRWVTHMAGQGFVMTAKPQLRGPFGFLDVERRDLGEDHREDDEYVVVGWFRRSKPLVISTDEVERRRLLAARYGYSPEAPVLSHRGDPTPKRGKVMADEMDDYRVKEAS